MNIEALRDEFATAALNGLVVSQRPDVPLNSDDLASLAYWIADSMLQARTAYCPNCLARRDKTKGFIVHVSGCTYGWQHENPTGTEGM